MRAGTFSRRSSSTTRSSIARASSSDRSGSGAGSHRPGGCTGGIRRQVAEQAGELDRGDAVHHAVMRLADHADPPVREPVGDPDLPQGPVALERSRVNMLDEAPDVAGGGLPHMVADVERGIVDPLRIVQAERDPGQLLAVARREGHAPCRCAAAARQMLERDCHPPAGRSRPSRRACAPWATPPRGTPRRAARGACCGHTVSPMPSNHPPSRRKVLRRMVPPHGPMAHYSICITAQAAAETCYSSRAGLRRAPRAPSTAPRGPLAR